MDRATSRFLMVVDTNAALSRRTLALLVLAICSHISIILETYLTAKSALSDVGQRERTRNLRERCLEGVAEDAARRYGVLERGLQGRNSNQLAR